MSYKENFLSSSPDWGSNSKFMFRNQKEDSVNKPLSIERDFNLKDSTVDKSKFKKDQEDTYPEINSKNYEKTIFARLFTSNEQIREKALRETVNLFRECVRSIDEKEDSLLFLTHHVPMIARLSTECPYTKIKFEFANLLQYIRDQVCFNPSFLFGTEKSHSITQKL
jgi:hypothetical protein